MARKKVWEGDLKEGELDEMAIRTRGMFLDGAKSNSRKAKNAMEAFQFYLDYRHGYRSYKEINDAVMLAGTMAARRNKRKQAQLAKHPLRRKLK